MTASQTLPPSPTSPLHPLPPSRRFAEPVQPHFPSAEGPPVSLPKASNASTRPLLCALPPPVSHRPPPADPVRPHVAQCRSPPALPLPRPLPGAAALQTTAAPPKIQQQAPSLPLPPASAATRCPSHPPLETAAWHVATPAQLKAMLNKFKRRFYIILSALCKCLTKKPSTDNYTENSQPCPHGPPPRLPGRGWKGGRVVAAVAACQW